MRGIETLMAEGKKTHAKKSAPGRYLLLVTESGETLHEFAHRNDVIGRIVELRQKGAHVEAFIDAKLEIGFTVKLEGMDP